MSTGPVPNFPIPQPDSTPTLLAPQLDDNAGLEVTLA